MFYSTVVDASYIQRNYKQISIIGKGRDFVHGIPSVIQLVEGEHNQKFALQIYENLNLETYQIKVHQLQTSMCERVTSFNSRIRLLGRREINEKTNDLYVLYDFDNLAPFKPTVEGEEQAIELLIQLANNILLQGRFTYEYLDVQPQNLFMNGNDLVITNFGLSYAGTKFERIYVPSSDPIFKQKSLVNIMYAYAFQAGLLVLQCMTGLDVKLLFFDDGQFHSQLASQLLALIKENKEEESEEKFIEKKRYKLEKFNKQLSIQYQKLPKNKRKQEPFDPKVLYQAQFLKYLSDLLATDNIQRRATFSQLVMCPDNLLDAALPIFDSENYKDKFKMEYNYYGQINKVDQVLSKDDIEPTGSGVIVYHDNSKDFTQFSGEFENGSPSLQGSKYVNQGNRKLYIIDEKKETQVLFQISAGDVEDSEQSYAFLGKVDAEYTPVNGKLLAVIPIDNKKPKKYTSVFYEGTFIKGQKEKGLEYFKDKNVFDGEYKDNKPKKGKMTYGQNHLFEGEFEGFRRKEGKLLIGDQEFKGEFEKDQIKHGTLIYGDGSIYNGNFKNGVRDGLGVYLYPGGRLKYHGTFKNNKMDGEADLLIVDANETKEQIQVTYQMGILKDEIPESFKEEFIKIQELKQKKKPPPIEKQQKNEDEIEEDINSNPGNQDDESQHYDMEDEDLEDGGLEG
ncbi:hypothetical protein pb186bvf_005795 [Paramecium bursaria]